MARSDENPETVAKFDVMIAEMFASEPEPKSIDEVVDRLNRINELWDEWFGPS